MIIIYNNNSHIFDLLRFGPIMPHKLYSYSSYLTTLEAM